MREPDEQTDVNAPTAIPTAFMLPAPWSQRLAQARAAKVRQPGPAPVVPLSPAYYSDRLTYVEDADGARSLAALARQVSLAYVGVDFEFRYDRPGVLLNKWGGKEHHWYARTPSCRCCWPSPSSSRGPGRTPG
jgi:hypothetical protein